MPIAEVRRWQDDGARISWDWRQDSTAVYIDAPSSHVTRVIWGASEPVASLFDGMDEGVYQRAAKAVAAKRDKDTENEQVFEHVAAHVWPAGHPYHREPNASDEEIANLPLADARRIHRACMVPNGATVIVTGNFDRARAEEAVKKYFGPIPSSGVDNACRKKITGTLPPSHAADLVFESGGKTAFVELAWGTPANLEADDLALDVAANAIQDRLDDRLVDNMHIASAVYAGQQSHAAGSMFYVQVRPATGHTNAEIRRAMEEELSRIARDGLSDDEVTTARRKVATLATSLDARRIAGVVAVDDGVAKLARVPDRYAKLDTPAVVGAIRTHLVPARRVVATVDVKSGAPIQGRLVSGGKR
jgi:zinc protease